MLLLVANIVLGDRSEDGMMLHSASSNSAIYLAPGGSKLKSVAFGATPSNTVKVLNKQAEDTEKS